MAEETQKEVKRGYVKWYDTDGVFHKEPLADHPELLKDASPREQLAAEEAKRMNAAGEREVEETKEEGDQLYLDTLADLKAAPEEVLTGIQLVTGEFDAEGNTITKPASAAEEPIATPNFDSSPMNRQPNSNESDEHETALKELRAATS